MEIEENEAFATVIQLIELSQGLGQSVADRLLMVYRKQFRGREMRKKGWDKRGGSDDWAARRLLEESLSLADSLANKFPDVQEELLEIREKINEQLAHFS
jgi:hypothetical protein